MHPKIPATEENVPLIEAYFEKESDAILHNREVANKGNFKKYKHIHGRSGFVFGYPAKKLRADVLSSFATSLIFPAILGIPFLLLTGSWLLYIGLAIAFLFVTVSSAQRMYAANLRALADAIWQDEQTRAGALEFWVREVVNEARAKAEQAEAQRQREIEQRMRAAADAERRRLERLVVLERGVVAAWKRFTLEFDFDGSMSDTALLEAFQQRARAIPALQEADIGLLRESRNSLVHRLLGQTMNLLPAPPN